MGIPRGQVILGSVKLAALVTTPQTQDCQQHLLLPKTLKDYSKPWEKPENKWEMKNLYKTSVLYLVRNIPASCYSDNAKQERFPMDLALGSFWYFIPL